MLSIAGVFAAPYHELVQALNKAILIPACTNSKQSLPSKEEGFLFNNRNLPVAYNDDVDAIRSMRAQHHLLLDIRGA